jgi:hypothetical protein
LGQGEAGIFGARSDPENVFIVRWPVGVQPEAGHSYCCFDTRGALGPKSNMMALARAVINCLLETDVLATSEQIKGAKRGGRIGRVEYECSDHAPRACQTQPIGLRPAGNRKGGMKLLACAYKHDIDGVTGQSVAGNCEARHAFTLQDFKAHPNGTRQDDISRDSIGEGQGQHPRQPTVRNFEDKNDQPDTKDAQSQDQQAAQYAFQQSHDLATMMALSKADKTKLRAWLESLDYSAFDVRMNFQVPHNADKCLAHLQVETPATP